MTFNAGIFGYGPNPSAALLEDGKIVAVAEEERFNRIKTASTSLPLQSFLYCLKEASIGVDDLAAIGFGWECDRYLKDMPAFYEKSRREYPPKTDDGYNALHEDYLMNLYHPKRIATDFRQGLATSGIYLDPQKIEFLPHHLCHAANAYYCSGFPEASILTIDGSGEEFTTFHWYGKNSEISELKHYCLPHSLGGYYATFTEFLGFRAYMDEGKLMGLSSYGRYSDEIQKKLDQVIPYDRDSGDFTINPYMRYIGNRTYGRRFTDEFVDLFGKPRLRHQPIEDYHRDLAYNVQWRLERIVEAMVRTLIQQTGCPYIAMSGGVVMNCCMNGKIALMPEAKGIYCQPASADNGIALGAAQIMAHRSGVREFEKMTHAYWGPSFTDDEILAAIKEAKLDYSRSENTIEEAAHYIDEGKIIGWFQGRMELGARALGNRSILASPLFPDIKDKLNREVKHREDWRPFCPSFCSDRYLSYFEDGAVDSDYMILAFDVKKEFHDKIPSVVHVDGTARPQTVRKETNPRFYALIEAFGRLSGHPVVVNTSFNVQGEPIVCTPRDAIRCFGGTGIDVLIMNDFILKKPGVS
ncbi:MAG: carbamoyltransferase [Candidatus Omnitrophica bacterium]|nr:carbamoyltransferase [Candidatus Omnitrophota bacterium]